MPSLGSRLKDLRLKRGKSLQAVADAVEASKPHIWDLERGNTKNPSLELITKLANFFGVPLEYLAYGDNEAPDELQMFARELERKNLTADDIEVLRKTAEALSKKN